MSESWIILKRRPASPYGMLARQTLLLGGQPPQSNFGSLEVTVAPCVIRASDTKCGTYVISPAYLEGRCSIQTELAGRFQNYRVIKVLQQIVQLLQPQSAVHSASFGRNLEAETYPLAQSSRNGGSSFVLGPKWTEALSETRRDAVQPHRL